MEMKKLCKSEHVSRRKISTPISATITSQEHIILFMTFVDLCIRKFNEKESVTESSIKLEVV
jgi:hypothetical protein